MERLLEIYSERKKEIEDYFSLLSELEKQVTSGVPRIAESGAVITTVQMRIMYSNVFILLYNMVEAIVNKSSVALSDAITRDNKLLPRDLSEKLKKEWVRYFIRCDVPLNDDNRLDVSLRMFEHLVNGHPIRHMNIVKGNSGNWDDQEIVKFSEKIGCTLLIRESSQRAIKRHFVNDQGPLTYVVKCRNRLAHGELSFAECSLDFTVSQLRSLKDTICEYMLDVVNSFETFISDGSFLGKDSPHDASGA